MSALATTLSDSAVITRRNLIKVKRVPDLLVFATLSPIMFVLLFRYVFGGAIQVPGDVGYAEFLVTDPRLPEDLREQAQKAMDGARAAAEQMSELKRLTRQEYEAARPHTGARPSPEASLEDTRRLQDMMAPVNGDPT